MRASDSSAWPQRCRRCLPADSPVMPSDLSKLRPKQAGKGCRSSCFRTCLWPALQLAVTRTLILTLELILRRLDHCESVATSTKASSWHFAFREFVIRQLCSARVRSRSACSLLLSEATESRPRTANPVNCVTRSTLSNVPTASHASDIQDSFDAAAMARKVSTKQPATAATSKVSGDQRSPGPLNSVGGALTSLGNRCASSETSPSKFADAVTV